MSVLALGLLLQVIAAPRTPYGGELIAYVWGRAGSADAMVHRALYEPLYAVDAAGKLIPNLAAELPQIDGTKVTIELRPNLVAHDGTPVTAERVVEWLAGLARSDSRGSFVVLPIAGARPRLRGENAPLGLRAAGPTRISIELAHPHPEIGRLLASVQAGIGVRSGAGTGAFKRAGSSDKGEIVLEPFLEHFVGRPFLDRVELRPLASRFGTAAIARKEQAALVFETPDAGRALRMPELSQREILVLSIGDHLADRRAALVAALGPAVNRRQLASRFLGGDAQPASTFLGDREPAGEATPLGQKLEAKLLVAREARSGHRFAERVQLDLHRAGVSVTIERRPAEEVQALRMSGAYELLVDAVAPDAPATGRSVDRLHALLSIGAAYGRADFADEALLARFFAAKEEQRRPLLDQLEEALRKELGLIPLANRTPVIAVRDDLYEVSVSPGGAIDLADSFLREVGP